jgi:hypothetical protein
MSIGFCQNLSAPALIAGQGLLIKEVLKARNTLLQSSEWNKVYLPGAGFTNFTKFLIRILLSFYHVAQAPRRTLVRLYQHIPTNSVGESGP